MKPQWAYVPAYEEDSGRSWWLRVLALTALSGGVLAVLLRGRRRER